MDQLQKQDAQVEEADDEEQSQERQTNQIKKKKKKKKKITGPLKVEPMADLKMFSAELNSAAIGIHGNFVLYRKKNMEYAMIDVTKPDIEQIISTFADVHPYVDPSGKLALAKVDARNLLYIYDIETKEEVYSYVFDLTAECKFCKWITPDCVALVSATEVYHWEIDINLDNADSLQPLKVFDRDVVTHGTPVSDYLVSDDSLKDWLLLVPEVNLTDGKNGLMQLFEVDSGESKLIPGYCACFTPCGKGITSFQMLHTVLCYISFESDCSSTFHAVELDLGLARLFQDNKSLSLPIALPDQHVPDQKDHCVRIYGSEKYGVAFVLTSLGWLFWFGLDDEDSLLKQNVNTGHAALGNNMVTTIGGDLSWTVNEQGIMVMYGNGVITKISLNEENIIPYLVDVVENSELAKYWAWRSNYYEQSQLQNQLKEQEEDFARLDDYAKEIEQDQAKLNEVELSFWQLQQQKVQHVHLLQFNNVLIDVKEQSIRYLEKRNNELLDRGQHRLKQQEYNRVWFQRQRRHQEQMKGPLEKLKQDPMIPWRSRYVSIDYVRHINMHKQFEKFLLENQQHLQKQEKKLQQVRRLQETEIRRQRTKVELMAQKLMQMLELSPSPAVIAGSGNSGNCSSVTSIPESDQNAVCSSSTTHLDGPSSSSLPPRDTVSRNPGNHMTDDVNVKHAKAGLSTDAISEKQLCIVCYERPYNTVFLPCRHMWLCEECAKAVFNSDKACPACRAEVKDIMPVFIPD